MTTQLITEFPVTIQAGPHRFLDITGKFGMRIATGEMAAEYESVDGQRMWMTVGGEVYPD